MKNTIKKILGSIFLSISIFIIGVFIFLLVDDSFMFSETSLIIMSFIFVIFLSLGTYLLVGTIDNKKIRKIIIRISLVTTFVIYLALLYSVTLGNSLYFRGGYDLQVSNPISVTISQSNFIPFKSILSYIDMFINNTSNKSIIITNLVGNLIMFMPMGILLPMIFRKLDNSKNMFFSIFLITASIEVCQLLLRSGSFDIDDIILNLLGGIIVYFIYSKTFIKKLTYKYLH